MKLKKLIKDLDLTVKGSKEIEITGISSNSKVIGLGNLFIARKGKVFDGAQFIPKAIENGAKAILTDIFDPFLENVTQIIHPNPTNFESILAQRYYGNPSEKMNLLAVTGTNGKTSISYLIKHLLDHKKKSCGLIGTIETITGSLRKPSFYSTPDIIQNHKLLKEMVLQNMKAVVMEVTSHALEQNRVLGLDFNYAIFTNLTPEHLDYHLTMQAYKNAKKKLFCSLKENALAVINKESPYAEEFLEAASCRHITYGLSSAADVYAQNIKLSLYKTTFELCYLNQKVPFSYPLIGRFNIQNILAVICVGIDLGYSLEEMAFIFQSFPQVLGRLEKVSSEPYVFVDFAHTEDALMNTLRALKEVTKKKVITVFGCGGDRDQEKRPKMARVSETLSHLTIVTSDNSRSENPEDICREIIKGFKTNKYFVEVDRKKAIEKAIHQAGFEDVVLIAGKGHEKVQIVKNQSFSFDDVVVAKEALKKRK